MQPASSQFLATNRAPDALKRFVDFRFGEYIGSAHDRRIVDRLILHLVEHSKEVAVLTGFPNEGDQGGVDF